MIILMRECDSKYSENCFNRAFMITQSRKIKPIRFASGCFKASCLLFVVILNVDIHSVAW